MSTIATSPRSLQSFGSAGPLVGTAHAPIDAGALLRRLGVAVLLLGLALVALVSLLRMTSVMAEDVAPPMVQVVVQPGQTVWELASEHRPSGMSTQDYAMSIVVHNDVDATALVPGSVLELPAAP